MPYVFDGNNFAGGLFDAFIHYSKAATCQVISELIAIIVVLRMVASGLYLRPSSSRTW